MDTGTRAPLGRGYRVVGVDPGLAHLGLGAVEEARREARLLGSRLVKTSPSMSAPARLGALRDGVMAFLSEHRPDAVVLESQFFHRQKATSFKVEGDYTFGARVVVKGDVTLPDEDEPQVVEDGTKLEG